MRAFLPWLMLGCTAPEEPAMPMEPVSHSYALTELTFSRAVDGVSDGFDLDGSSATSCGIDDLTSSDGTPGIDNSFAELVPLIELAGGPIDELLQASVVSGALLYVVEWTEPPSEPGGCDTITLTRTWGAPMRGASGALVPGQTLRRSGVHPPITLGCASPEPGVVRAEGFTLPVEFEVLGFPLSLSLTDAVVELRREGDRMEGLLGGALGMEELLALTSEVGGAGEELSLVLGEVLRTRADLGGDPCTSMSAALHIGGLVAFTFDGSFDSGL